MSDEPNKSAPIAPKSTRSTIYRADLLAKMNEIALQNATNNPKTNIELKPAVLMHLATMHLNASHHLPETQPDIRLNVDASEASDTVAVKAQCDAEGAAVDQPIAAPRPPALAEWVMAAMVAPGETREAFLGDYSEHFDRSVRTRGVRWAKWMVYADAARSVWPLAWMAFKRISWIAAIVEWKERVMG